MVIHSNRPLAADTRLLLAHAAAAMAKRREVQCWEDDGGRIVARPAPAPIGDPQR